jgi:hypothetical protein
MKYIMINNKNLKWMHHDAPQQFFLEHITSMVNDPE